MRMVGHRAGGSRPRIGLAGSSALALVVAACGYHAVYGQARSRGCTSCSCGRSCPDVVASDEVAAGLREELARAGALEAGEGFPRVEIEVLRADEASEGIAAGANGPRRARDRRGPGCARVDCAGGRRAAGERHGRFARRGGDRRRRVGRRRPDPRASAFHDADALRAAARRLGRRLGDRVTGQPASSDDGIESR